MGYSKLRQQEEYLEARLACGVQPAAASLGCPLRPSAQPGFRLVVAPSSYLAAV